MNLFSKDKGVVHNLVNAVLLFWILISITLVCNSIVNNIFFREKTQSYNEYKEENCYIPEKYDVEEYDSEKDFEEEVNEAEKDCKSMYKDYKYSLRYDYQLLTGAIISLIISTGATILVNKK